MSETYHLAVSAEIDARPEELYAIMADYHVGHPAVLPRPPFTYLTVDEGGYGEGTIMRFGVKMFGKEQHAHQRVTEPEPGRVLKETDLNINQSSTFIFDPIGDGSRTRMTIASSFPRRAGIAGFIEQLLVPPLLRPVYKKELQQIADYARSKRETVGG